MKYIILFFIAAAVVFLMTQQDSNPTENLVVPANNAVNTSSFIMKNDLTCTVEEDSEGRDKGKIISLLDLETDSPKALFPSGVQSTMKKISDTSDLLVIQLVASGTGSTDTITLFKASGKFEREEKGSTGGDFSYSQKGQCK